MRLFRHAEFVARMVLRETAIGVRVLAAPGAGPQVGHQFVQFDRAPSDLDPDENFARRRSHQQIELAGRGVMLVFAWFQTDVTPEPASLEDQPRGGRQLTNIFPKKPPRFLREDSITRGWFVRVRSSWQQFALHLAMLVNGEKVFAYSAAEKFILPRGQRRTDPKTGIESCLQPGFEVVVQGDLKLPATYRVAAACWLAFSCRH